MNIDFSSLLWLFALAVTVHMIEEVIWLPAWSQAAAKWHEPVTATVFAFATIVMLLFLYLIAYRASGAEVESLSLYLVCGLALVMIVNLVIPHLGATIAQRRYAPGLVTSLILVVPAATLLLWRALASGRIGWRQYLLVGPAMLIGAAVIWPALFRVGRRLFR